jgi:hypothetical protein
MIFEAFISVPSQGLVGEEKFGAEPHLATAANGTAALTDWKQSRACDSP